MLLNEARSRSAAARIKALVEGALKEKGISARKASIDVVGHDGLVRDIRAGRIPAADRLDALFEYLGLPSILASPGKAEPAALVPVGFSEHAGGQASFDVTRMAYLPFPWHRHMGERGTSPIAISKAWLSEAGLDPAGLSVIRTPLPVTWDDGGFGLALIDESAPKEGCALWGWREFGKSFVGRITWPSGKEPAILESYDFREPPRMLVGAARSEVLPLGKVVWLARSID